MFVIIADWGVFMSMFKILMHSIPAVMILSVSVAASAQEVNVYSYRKPVLIQPMFEVFSEQTGIKVNAVNASKGLLERLKNEGRNTPADVVLTTDIGRLTDAKKAGLTRAISSETINSTIPPAFRDAQNHWFGLTTRARIIVTSRERVAAGGIGSYEDLATGEWKGRVCTRSGKHPYMVALSAAMIKHHGEKDAETWLRGVKNNLARKPQGNDRAQVKAISEGECDVAIINHYYMAKMLADEKQKSWAESVRVVFPNQESRGTHMNVSGMAMTKYAPHPDNALKLMEFLVGAHAQEMYARINGEYPLKAGIVWPELLQSWGEYKVDDVALSEIATYRAAAIKMADRTGYDR